MTDYKLVPTRDDLIQCLLATRGQSEGVTADAILSMLTAAPAVQGEPVAYRAWFDQDSGARWLFTLWPEEERLDVAWQPLYTQAPAVDDAVLLDAVADAIGRDTYDCSRAWSAWGYGTMSEDDFTPIINDINRLQEIVDAVKAAIKGEG